MLIVLAVRFSGYVPHLNFAALLFDRGDGTLGGERNLILMPMLPPRRARMIKDGGITTIENYCYEDHPMLKRAGVQCVLNLMQSEEASSFLSFTCPVCF